MTVASSTDRVTFPGNGVTQIFPLPFRFFANSEIQAWLVTNATGALTALTLGTHYTLSGAGDPEVDGNPTSELTMLAAPTSLQSLFVQRVIPVTQPTDIVNQGRFFPEIHENVFDRLTMLIQQANGESKGAIRVAIGDPEPARLPNAVSRALLLLGFDSAGNPIAVAPVSGSASDLAMNLANDTDPAKGAGQVGRAGQVVGSIAALRLLDKTAASKNAFVTGYYSPGDGGGGPYFLDAADVTSADNGGTIIVAADLGRWKLKNVSTVSIKQFGAKGDGVTNDKPSIQATIDWWAASQNTGVIHAPTGNYVLFTKAVVPKLSKGLTFKGDGEGTVFRGGAAFGGHVIEIGDANPVAGVPYEFKDFKIAAPLSGTTNGIKAINANTIRFDGITLQSCVTGFELDACFAVQFRSCLWDVVTSYGIFSATAAHNLVVDGCRFFSVGSTIGQAIQIETATDNIVIQNSDFEQCRGVYSITSGSAITVTGNYIEFCSGIEFNHNGVAKGLKIYGNWISLNTLGSVTYNNIEGGEFSLNTVFNQAIAWGATVSHFDVGINNKAGTGSIAATPFTTITVFSNSWTAGTRVPGYKKDLDGTVSLRGEIASGTLSAVAFVLPAGFRPAQQMRVATASGVGSTAFGATIIDSNGNFVPQTGTPLSLDGISFKAGAA